MKFIVLSIISFGFTQYYNLDIAETGQSHLIVFQETINIEDGWEIGVFDQNAIINDGNCYTDYGELLVATGIWNGNQLDFSAIGSIDFCDIGGEQRAGYMEDNEISIRIYNPFESVEYTTNYSTFDGMEPSFISGFLTAISALSIDEVYAYNSINSQQLLKDFRIESIYPNPANPSVNINFEVFQQSNLSIEIYGINGQNYYLKSFKSNIGLQNYQFDINSFSSGIYFVKLISKNNSSIQKFVVQK